MYGLALTYRSSSFLLLTSDLVRRSRTLVKQDTKEARPTMKLANSVRLHHFLHNGTLLLPVLLARLPFIRRSQSEMYSTQFTSTMPGKLRNIVKSSIVSFQTIQVSRPMFGSCMSKTITDTLPTTG
jgi:hypothetical protein